MPLRPCSNTKSNDHDLYYGVRVQVPAGDTATSASLMQGTDDLFSLTGKGFSPRGDTSVAGGIYKSISTLKTAGGLTYLAVLEAMIASPYGYTAQVVSANAPNGLASGAFGPRDRSSAMPNPRIKK